MDKEQARFILQSFRPDGADAQDTDFAEALAKAAEDRDLGAWLAAERSQDAAFAAAVARIPIPEDLREVILAVLEGGGRVPEDEVVDDLMVRALAAIRPPRGLREGILSAMEAERRGSVVSGPKGAPRRVWKWINTAAVAAAVALGAFLALEVSRDDQPAGTSGPALASLTKRTVEHSAIRLVSGEFTLDFKKTRPQELVTYLDGRHMPVPLLEDLPPGLAGMAAIGCKVLQIGDKEASLICFNKDGLGTVHLVVVRREDLGEILPGMEEAGKACWQCPKTAISVAAWQRHGRAYFLLGKVPPAELARVF